MREGEPSRTAYGAAVLRAQHQDHEAVGDPPVFTDPLARRILGEDAELPDHASGGDLSRLRRFIAVRHRFAEDSLAAARRRGTRQAVVLGAGFDTFAYRNPWPDLRVWEVDHPATGAWKRDRLAETGIEVPATVTYVAVDFEQESFLDTLAVAGLDATAPTFFLWLGVVPYLSSAAVEATLRSIGSIPGGEVVFDHTASTDRASERAQAERADLEARVADLGEPFRSAVFEPSDLRAMLTQAGFDEVEVLGRSEIRERYLGLPPDPRPGGGHVVRALHTR